MDLDNLAEVLNTSSQEMRKLSEKAQNNPAEAMTDAMSMAPKITQTFAQLKELGNRKAVLASVAKNPNKSENFQKAIQTFLESSKVAQEKAGSMQAALFGNPVFQEFTQNLEHLSQSLERVDRKEDGGV